MDRLRGLTGKLYILGYTLLLDDDWVVIFRDIKGNCVYIDKTMEKPVISKEYKYIGRYEYFIHACSNYYSYSDNCGFGEEIMIRGSMQNILEYTNTTTAFICVNNPGDYFHKREILLSSCDNHTDISVFHNSGKIFKIDITKYMEPTEELRHISCIDTDTESYMLAEFLSPGEPIGWQKTQIVSERKLVVFDTDFNMIKNNTLENIAIENKLVNRLKALASKIISK